MGLLNFVLFLHKHTRQFIYKICVYLSYKHPADYVIADLQKWTPNFIKWFTQVWRSFAKFRTKLGRIFSKKHTSFCLQLFFKKWPLQLRQPSTFCGFWYAENDGIFWMIKRLTFSKESHDFFFARHCQAALSGGACQNYCIRNRLAMKGCSP